MKALAIIVLILIFPLFFLAILGLSLKFTVQNKGFIKKELKSQNVYAKVNRNFSEIVGLLPEDKEEGAPAPLFTNAALGNILREALTPQILEENTELLLDGKKADESQQKRFSDSILKIVEAKYNTLPVCPAGQEPKEMSCRPNGVSFEELKKQLPADGTLHIESVNGDFRISQTTGVDTADNSQGQKQSGSNGLFLVLGKLTALTYVLPFILLFIIFFLARGFSGTWLGGAKVFGIFLAVLSFFSLALNLLLSLANKPLANTLSGFANKMPKLKNELIMPLLNDILGKISQMTDKISIISAIIGIVIFIIFFIITKAKKKNQPTPAVIQS